MIKLPKPPLCLVLAVLVVLPQCWGLLWFPVRVEERSIHLDYWRVIPHILSGMHVHAMSSSSYIRLWEVLLCVSYYISFTVMLLVEIPSQLLCICGTEENTGSGIGCTLWWNGIFARFQRFSSIGTMFWIRHHPSVSLFNDIPQNCAWASGFLFCLHTCRSCAYVDLRYLGLWEMIRNDNLSPLFSWNISVGDFFALCIWTWGRV